MNDQALSLSGDYWDSRYRTHDTGWDMGRISPPLQAYFQQLPRKDLSILIPGCGNAYEAAWLLGNGFTDLTVIDISTCLMDSLRQRFSGYPSSRLQLITGDFFRLDLPIIPSRTGTGPASTPPVSPDSIQTVSSAKPSDISAATPATPAASPGATHHSIPPVLPAPPAADPGPSLTTNPAGIPNAGFDLIIEQTFFCALDPTLRPRYIEQAYHLLRPGGKLTGLLFDRTFPSGPPFGGTQHEYKNLLEKKFHIRTLAPCYNSIPPRAGSELFFIAERPAAQP